MIFTNPIANIYTIFLLIFTKIYNQNSKISLTLYSFLQRFPKNL